MSAGPEARYRVSYSRIQGGQGDEAEKHLAAGLDTYGRAVRLGQRVNGIYDLGSELGQRAERLMLDVVQQSLDGRNRWREFRVLFQDFVEMLTEV